MKIIFVKIKANWKFPLLRGLRPLKISSNVSRILQRVHLPTIIFYN